VAAAVGRLSEGIAHARAKYDEYIPMAYQALLHRASQLKEEVRAEGSASDGRVADEMARGDAHCCAGV
jgi:hypothetical protein